jgi:hypothetical protein
MDWKYEGDLHIGAAILGAMRHHVEPVNPGIWKVISGSLTVTVATLTNITEDLRWREMDPIVREVAHGD